MDSIDQDSIRHSETAERSTNRARPGVGLADFSVRYPVTICMIFVLFVTLGLISVFKIPLELQPTYDWPFLRVHVPYRNASPGQIQESITKPLEEALSTVPAIQQMSSTSTSSSARVHLTFPYTEDINTLRPKVRERVQQVRKDLPEDIEHISIQSWSSIDRPILHCALASEQDLHAAADLLELKVKKPLERIPGVARVDLWNVQPQEIDIYLRLDDLKRHRVDVGQLFRRLDSVNLDRSLGRVVDGSVRYNAIARGTMASLDEIAKLPVDERGLQLSDIADIKYDTPPTTSGRHLNGKNIAGFSIWKKSQANTVETANRVMAKIEELGRDPGLKGIEPRPFYNLGEMIMKSLSGLLRAGAVGSLLAIFVLIFFLRRFGATLIIALSIPFSIITAVGFLYLLGRTLNVFSMMGLIVAIGMLVDNAVVVLESIYRKLEQGTDRVMAARVGTQEVYTAVIAATLTSIIIFVPLLILRDTTHYTETLSFLYHIGPAMILALLCSLFISLTLIPMAMARLLRMDGKRQSRWQRWIVERVRLLFSRVGRLIFRHRKTTKQREPTPTQVQAAGGTITDAYLKLVSWPLQHRFLVGLVIVPLVVYGSYWLLMNKVPDNTPEAREKGWLNIQYEFSENFHYAKIERDYVVPVEQFLLANQERFKIKTVFSHYSNNSAQVDIQLHSENMAPEEMEPIRKEITERLPVIPGADIRLSGQRGLERQGGIGANLYGDNPETLQKLAAEARHRFLNRSGFAEVHTAIDSAKEEVQIRLHRNLARKYGISPQSVSRLLSIIVRGRRVSSYRTPNGEVDITVWLQPEDRNSLADLESLVVSRGTNGQPILLSQVADLRIEKTPSELRRSDRRTHTEIRTVYSGDRREEGMKHFSDIMNTLNYPQGYGWSYNFYTQQEEQAGHDFLLNILLALFMVYFVMASLFESLAHPFAIMFSLPFGIVGVAWFLFLTGAPFNAMAQIGSVVLIGIVVNNGIVLIAHINNLRRKGMPRSQAILKGCRERFRPIVMTATTTIVGLIPLAYGYTGMTDWRYFPLARAVMGGLMASTVLTLIILPTYYTLFEDLANWIKQTWHASDPSRGQRPVQPSANNCLKSRDAEGL